MTQSYSWVETKRMLNQIILSDLSNSSELLTELSIKEQEVLTGGHGWGHGRRHHGWGHHGWGHGRRHGDWGWGHGW
jgi:hypothetical protein